MWINKAYALSKFTSIVLLSFLALSIFSVLAQRASYMPLSSQNSNNAPFTDMEAKFTVYPDGRVVMGGALNYTQPYPYMSGIDMFGDASFTRTGSSTEMSANFAFTPQPQSGETFPLHGSSFNMIGTYSDDIANITIDGFVTFPPSIASQFPLNLLDFTVVADYLNDEITGTITVPLVSGVPIATMDVNFHGNLTDLYLSDELPIVYGNFFGYEINETVVEDLLQQINSTILGTGPESLYGATNGMLQCARLNTNVTKEIYGITITFDAHIHGDFVQALVFYMTGVRTDPNLQCFAEALASSIETGHFELAYSHGFGGASMQLAFTSNFTRLRSDLESTLPRVILPQQIPIVELLLNTPLCSVARACAVTYGMPQLLPLQLQIINEAGIDLSNLSVTFNMTRTSILYTIQGFEVMPPIDPVDSDTTQFKLERFFSLTSSPYGEPPTKDSRLKITVEGGYNSTHTVLLHAPNTVPNPDKFTLDYTSMTWKNTTLSSLKDLVFKVAHQDVIDYLGKAYHVPIVTNSTLSNFNFNPDTKSISFNVSGITGIGFSEITIPRALLYAALGDWSVKLDGITLTSENFTVTENAEYVFITLNYSHSEHSIELIGTWIITEFNPNMLLIILMALTLIVAVVAVKQRKKLSTITTKYQNAIHTFANKLHQLRT